MPTYKTGDAIIHVPPSTGGNPYHPAARQGVVVEQAEDTVLCKFYFYGTRIMQTVEPEPVPATELRRRKGYNAA